MAFVKPITLAAHGIKLVPLTLDHEPGLRAAAADGELWNLRITSVPAPEEARGYIDSALKSFEEGHHLAFAVIEEASGAVLGSTSYHDILPTVKRVEIGSTWYAKRAQRTHVNTTCKLTAVDACFRNAGL